MENQLVKKSGIIAAIATFALLGAWFGFSKLSLGIDTSNWTPYAMGKNSVVSEQLIIMCGTSGSGIVFGTTSGGWVGTPTDSTLARVFFNTATSRLEFKPSGSTTSFPFGSITPAYLDANYATIGSVSAKLDAIGGVGTNNTFYNPTLAGSTTIGTTSTITAEGTTFSATKVKYLADVDESIEPHFTTVEASISGHAHAGTDSVKISHNNVTGTGANSHPIIDDFIASKAQGSGLASLDANSLVIQNPASASKTPGTSTIVMTGTNTDRIADAYLSGNITKLGTPTTDNISEGSTNKYYTDSRVNAAVGSLSVNTLSDVNIIFNENDFVKIVGGQLVAGSSTVTVAFSEVTGSASASQLPLVSGLLGSASSAQLPTVLRLPGTTTVQPANANGQMYVYATTTSYLESGTVLLLHFNNPGTTTVIDSSENNLLVSPVGNAIGTTTAKFGSGGEWFGGINSGLSLADSALYKFPGEFSIETQVRVLTLGAEYDFGGQFQSAGNRMIMRKTTTEAFYWEIESGTVSLMNITTAAQSINTSTFNNVKFRRIGNNFDIVFNGTVIGSTTASFTYPDYSAAFQIGYLNAANYSHAVFDEFRIQSGTGTAANATNPTGEYGLIQYTQYNARYTDPVNGNVIFEIKTTGTSTTNASYIYCNASTTVFGLGTNTAITATTTVYSGWYDGAVRATAFNVASSEKIKDNIKSIKVKPDLLDAEGEAKQKYIVDNKGTWTAANQANYTTVVIETGTGTVTYINTDAMESAYSIYIELEWASNLNQDALTESVQTEHEREFWQKFNSIRPKSWNPKDKPNLVRKGFVVEESPDEIKGDDKETIDPMALIAYTTIVLQSLREDTQKQSAEIGSLTAALENQKIAYNEEVDNLYKLINAIIVALVALGGVGGWTTMRRKRKGT